MCLRSTITISQLGKPHIRSSIFASTVLKRYAFEILSPTSGPLILFVLNMPMKWYKPISTDGQDFLFTRQFVTFKGKPVPTNVLELCVDNKLTLSTKLYIIMYRMLICGTWKHRLASQNVDQLPKNRFPDLPTTIRLGKHSNLMRSDLWF